MIDTNACRTKPVSQAWPVPSSVRNSRRLICLTGFGHSGSGAVADLLAEYAGVHSVSYADLNGSLNSNSSCEFVLLTASGGLFDLEKDISTHHFVTGDLAIKKFLRLIAYLHNEVGGLYNESFINASRLFLDQLIEEKSIRSGYNGYVFCPQFLVLGREGARLIWGDDGCDRVFWIRNLTVSEFRGLARRYLRNVFNGFSDSSILLLDQVVSDGTADFAKYAEYLGDYKLIAVYRDPRDVYATANMLKVAWIPHNLEVFRKWYKDRVAKYLSARYPGLFILRFEDLVLNYEESVRNIERFLDFKSETHISPKKCFDPNVSLSNIGIYKKFVDAASIQFIAEHLGEYCYNSNQERVPHEVF